MSTYFADIQTALNVRLDSLTSHPPIAYENVEARQSAATEYLRPTFLPGQTDQASLGDAGKDVTNGIYQVDVFTKLGSGWSAWPDAIADHFKRGTTLTKNNVTLRIVNASIERGLKDEPFYIVPVTIRWQVHTDARS